MVESEHRLWEITGSGSPPCGPSHRPHSTPQDREYYRLDHPYHRPVFGFWRLRLQQAAQGLSHAPAAPVEVLAA